MNDYELGIVGLGVMGANLALNISDHGFSVVGLDTDAGRAEDLKAKAAANPRARGAVTATTEVETFVSVLRKPRAVLMLVPAGKPVDGVIEELMPHLEREDVLIDGGNSHFTDTDRREKQLVKGCIHFMGMGVSGGEAGARHGPSMMPGGSKAAWERVQRVLEAAAAKVDGEPCVAWLGRGAAGHYVKMVHNGIEYALMELIAETYDLMKRGLGMSNDELHEVYAEWSRGELGSYLLEITADIFRKEDQRSGQRLIDVILDVAHQKGTGVWDSQDAMQLQVAVPTIDSAVSMRALSTEKARREAASERLPGPASCDPGDRREAIGTLRGALHAGMILSYAQGMHQVHEASDAYHYGLKLEQVARVWRGGCIIRAALLEDLRQAYARDPKLAHPLDDAALARKVAASQAALRDAVGMAARCGIPAAGLMSALAYYDAHRSARLPANLLQAQRDYFGSHQFQRVDGEGMFHAQWQE